MASTFQFDPTEAGKQQSKRINTISVSSQMSQRVTI